MDSDLPAANNPLEPLFYRSKQIWFALDVRCLSLLTPLAAFAIWEGFALTYSFQKRYIFSPGGRDFNYVLFVSCWQQALCLLLLAPLVIFRLVGANWGQFRRNSFGLMSLGTMWVLSQLCLSAAQSFLGNSNIELIKCCMPFPALVFSLLLERDRRGVPVTYPWGLVLSIALVICAACMVVFDSSQSSVLGYVLAILSTCMTACYYVAANVLLKTSAGGLNALNMTWYIACVSTPLLLLFFFSSTETNTIFTVISEQPDLLGWLTLTSLLYVLTNVSAFVLIGVTSALSITVGECMKFVLIQIISVGYTHFHYSSINVAGLALFWPTLFFFAYLNFLRRFEIPPEPAALEAGMAMSNKGKLENSALLSHGPSQASSTCCVLQ